MTKTSDGQLEADDRRTIDGPQTDSSRFVSYRNAARSLHLSRLWAATSLTIGFAVIAVETGTLRFRALTAIALVFMAHSGWRSRSPGSRPDDAVHIDNVGVLSYFALLSLPAEVVIVGLAYMLLLSILFLSEKMIGWTVGYVLVGTAALRWLSPFDAPSSDLSTQLAIIFLVAAVVPLARLASWMVTALKQRQAMASQLRSTTERFRGLFEQSAVAMFRATLDGRVLEVNDALVGLFHARSQADLRAEPSLLRYSDPAARSTLLDELLSKGRVQGFEALLRRIDGSQFWGRLSVTLVTEDSEQFLEGVVEDISEQHAAAARERLNAAVFDQLGSSVIVADSNRRLVSWNTQARALFGLEDSVRGLPLLDVIEGGDTEEAAHLVDEAVSQGGWKGELDLPIDGRVVPVSVSTTSVEDESGNHVGYATVFTDLTTVRAAEEQLRLQAALLNQVQSAVVATDNDRTVIFWNRHAERLYGWSGEEALGAKVGDLIVPVTGKELASEIIADLRRTGEWHGEFQVSRKDGSTFPVLVSNAVFRNAAGEPAGLVAVSSDLTALRRAEESAQQAQRLGHAVLGSVRFPVAVLSSEGTILDVNPAWEDFSSQNNGDAATNGIGVDYLAPVRVAAASDPDLVEVIEGVEGVLGGHRQFFTRVYPCHSPTEERWFRMQVTPIPGVGAAIAHVNVTTEVLARKALERTVEEKDQFLATVSHELRTPLTAVLGFSEHLISRQFTPDELDEYHGLIAGQAREVADLVEDLLLAGRLDTATITIRPERISIAQLIDSVVKPWRDSEQIVITTSADHGVVADPLRTRQIVRNLVTNAIRHGSAPLEIRTEHEDSTTVIHVIDSGPGVAPEVVQRMYEPYSEASEHHGQPGSVGLGLFISHRLAELMGGTLTYQRSEETTIFTLTLPAPHSH